MTDPAGWGGYSPQEMGELIRYLEPWFDTRGGSGGIRRVMSADGSVVVNRPAGPVVDLSARSRSVIYDFTVASAQSSIDTSTDGPDAGTLDQSFAVMEAWFYGRSDANITGANARVTFNGDTGNHYFRAENRVQGTGPATNVPTTGGAQAFLAYRVPAANGTAGAIGMFRLSVPGYAEAVLHKAGEGTGGLADDGDSEGIYSIFRWKPSSLQAITRLTVHADTGNWITGSRLTIIGR